MQHTHRFWIVALTAAVAATTWSWSLAADDGPSATAEDAAGAEPASDDEVMQQLMQQRQAPPVVEPNRAPAVESVPSRVGTPAARVDLDPSVVGVAPGQEQPELRREGEFVINRRGRLVRSSDGIHVLFVFDADGKESPEPPMILQPCRYLETMENIVQERGDTVVFELSGQIHTYRGANYLLPTTMRVVIDRNNLGS